jgi:hypothetical protein
MALQWNPGVNDRSGEILGAATANAANIRMQGQQMLAQGVQQGTQAVAGGFTDAMSAYMTQKQEQRTNAGKVGLYTEAGILDPEMGQQLLQMPVQEQRPYLDRLDNMMAMQDRIEFERERESMSRWSPDFDTVQRVRAMGGDIVQTSKGSAQIMQPKQPDPVNMSIQRTTGGLVGVNPQTLQAQYIPDPNDPNQVLQPAVSVDPLIQALFGQSIPGGTVATGGAGTPSQAQPTAQPDPRGMPQVNSQAQYDALPSGTQYVDANGNIRTKR